MKLLVIGLNHKTADLETREKLAFGAHMVEEGLAGLRNVPGVKEAALLSTCNRVEIYACVDDPPSAAEDIKNFLASFHNIPAASFEKALYTHIDSDAVKHVFRVASSLDSMIIGEPQILGQLKDVFDLALSKKTTGIMLNKLMKTAISTAKRIRTETKIAENAVSISFAAVELARKIFINLAGKSFMLLGAGEMAELAAHHLVNNGVREVAVVNRTHERGCELACEFNGRAVKFEEFVPELAHMDIIICSTGARNYILTKDQMTRVMKERKHRPVFIIDISVPRNIDPEINRIENVYLYDIDDLQEVIESNILERKKESEKAELIIDEEVGKFLKWTSSLDSVPTIVALRRKAEEIKSEEIDKFKGKFPEVNGEQLKAVEYLASAIVNKLIHPPTTALKDDSEDRDELIAMIRKLYDINGDDL